MGALLGFLGKAVLPAGSRWIIYGALAFSLATLLTGYGYMKGSERLYKYQAEQARAAVAVVTKQGIVTERVVNHYIKVKGATQTVTQTVEKEVVKYVETNTGSCLDGRWRVLHDAAASNTVPQASGGTDAAPGAAQALATVTGNYSVCHREEDKLRALQEWVREQQKARP